MGPGPEMGDLFHYDLILDRGGGFSRSLLSVEGFQSFLAVLLVEANPPSEAGLADIKLLTDEFGGVAFLELELHGLQPEVEGVVFP
jgi:hypothetical protein